VDEQVLGDEKVALLAKGGVAFLFDQISVISRRKLRPTRYLIGSSARMQV